MSTAENRISTPLLFYPPFADPTQPYISLPVLKGYLKKKGSDATVIDLNIQSLYYLMSKDFITTLSEKIKKRFRELNGKKFLIFTEQVEYKRLIDALYYLPIISAPGFNCVSIMKEKESFYNYKKYLTSACYFETLFECINALYFPYQFGFNRASHFVLPFSFDMLEHYCADDHSPLSHFYKERFKNIGEMNNVIAGISISFISQIPEALYLARFLKQIRPELFIVLGGSCIGQVIRNLSPDLRKRVFDFCDALCYAEGEETLAALALAAPKLKTLRQTGDGYKMFDSIPNLYVYNRRKEEIHSGPFVLHDLRGGCLPDYSDLDLDLYLAPERLLLYSPTRNCYWNKCSFCTYGFSFDEKNTYREVPARIAAGELQSLKEQYGADHFYLSCDVLAPKYAEKLARELISRKAGILWSGDFRLENYYTPEVCKILYASGLRSVAFGVESGSAHMLHVINKGISVEQIRQVNSHFHDTKIATQWMTFTYHPGETVDDAIETLSLIKEEADKIDLFITGEFQLVPGSRIAHSPKLYGITKIYFTEGDDLRLFPLFKGSTINASWTRREDIDDSIDWLAEKYALSHYPWAGAISTHHTFLFFCHYGQNVFKRFAKEKQNFFPPEGGKLNIKDRIRFALPVIEKNEQRFYTEFVRKAIAPGDNDYSLSERFLFMCNEKIKRIFPRKKSGFL
ncbi:MAG: radical SAM protein [Spirochaetales bacterium]|nr:radical SAM protein [Spirochaetales bacterium]